MPPERYFVEGRLAEIEENLRFIRELLASQEEAAFCGSLSSCYSCAYALIVTVEAAAAVASHIIASQGWVTPRGMPESFELLGRHGVLNDMELIQRLGAMARFRNLLVHRYWRVDYAQVYRSLATDLSDLEQFSQAVLTYLDQVSES